MRISGSIENLPDFLKGFKVKKAKKKATSASGDKLQSLLQRQNIDKAYSDNINYSSYLSSANQANEDHLLLQEDNEDITQKYKFDSISTIQVWGYSVGHFFNDLIAAVMFKYFFPNLTLTYVPYIILSGQIADGLATPAVGYFSDRTKTRWGKRTPWYFCGTIVIQLSYLPIFLPSFLPNDVTPTGEAVFYTIMYVLINLVPSITCSRQRRDLLNGRRNTFTFIASLLILSISMILFQYCTSEESFVILTYVFFRFFHKIKKLTSAIGMSCCIFFLSTIREVSLSNECQVFASKLKIKLKEMLKKPDESVSSWFKKPLFYQCGLIYMGARLYCNILAMMTNFYLVRVLRFASEKAIQEKTPIQIALIPLILYISSVLMSALTEYLFIRFGRKWTFTLGFIFAVGTSLCLAIINEKTNWAIYPVSVFIGAAEAIALNTGMNLISEVIGVKGSSGAFVFGCYSFLDKFSSGIVLFVITIIPQFKDPDFTRWCMVLIPLVSYMYIQSLSIAHIMAFLCVLIQKTKDAASNVDEDEFRNDLERELAQ